MSSWGEERVMSLFIFFSSTDKHASAFSGRGGDIEVASSGTTIAEEEEEGRVVILRCVVVSSSILRVCLCAWCRGRDLLVFASQPPPSKKFLARKISVTLERVQKENA